MARRNQVRFEANPKLNELLAKDKKITGQLLISAQKSAAAARAIAPVLSGRYRDGIEASVEMENGAPRVRVVGRDQKSAWIEFGTSRMRAHACMRRGVESVGLRMTRVRGRK